MPAPSRLHDYAAITNRLCGSRRRCSGFLSTLGSFLGALGAFLRGLTTGFLRDLAAGFLRALCAFLCRLAAGFLGYLAAAFLRGLAATLLRGLTRAFLCSLAATLLRGLAAPFFAAFLAGAMIQTLLNRRWWCSLSPGGKGEPRSHHRMQKRTVMSGALHCATKQSLFHTAQMMARQPRTRATLTSCCDAMTNVGRKRCALN